MKSKKYYVVFSGRQTGIFLTWPDCNAQVHGYSGARYKSYCSQSEAEAALSQDQKSSQLDLFSKKSQLNSSLDTSKPDAIQRSGAFIQDSLAVDASCLGNPGDLEYRGVHVATRNIIFSEGPLAYGTNNIGEFLAIVQALEYLRQNQLVIPIYSDSLIAIGWVQKKRVQTKLIKRLENQEIFIRLDLAINWLHENICKTQILKWDTKNWGEIPADYDRK